jgi:probable phosphoglycerate mutase
LGSVDAFHRDSPLKIYPKPLSRHEKNTVGSLQLGTELFFDIVLERRIMTISPSSLEIIIVRHGQTDFNKRQILQGHADPPLNDTGKAQATAAGQRLDRERRKIDALWSSDLIRCRQTSDLILGQSDLHSHIQPVYWEDLRERAMGEMEGLHVVVAHEKAKAENKTMHDYGEPKKHSVKRLNRAWEALVEESLHKGYHRIMIVSHGGVTAQFCRHLIRDMGYTFSPSVTDDDIKVPHNCSFTVVTVDRLSREGVIQTFGDSLHLSGLYTTVDQRAL